MSEEAPPIGPRIEQFGEKVGGIAIILLIAGLFGYAILSRKPLDVEAMAEVFPELLQAAGLTLGITVGAYFAGMGLGFLIGWQKSSRRRMVRAPATVWVEALRGTPFFVQLLLLNALMSYYNPGDLEIATRVLITGFVALFLNTSAYQAEIFRAGLQSVHAGQVDAARAIGLNHWSAMRNVILPQAVRVVVPPLMNEFIALLKASALLSVISIRELTYQAKTATSFGQPWLEISLIVTLLYLLMTVPLAKIVGFFERRFRIPGLGMHQEPVARRARGTRSVAARTFGFGVSDGVRNLLTRRPDATATHGADLRGRGRRHRPETAAD